MKTQKCSCGGETRPVCVDCGGETLEMLTGLPSEEKPAGNGEDFPLNAHELEDIQNLVDFARAERPGAERNPAIRGISGFPIDELGTFERFLATIRDLQAEVGKLEGKVIDLEGKLEKDPVFECDNCEKEYSRDEGLVCPQCYTVGNMGRWNIKLKAENESLREALEKVRDKFLVHAYMYGSKYHYTEEARQMDNEIYGIVEAALEKKP